MISLETMGYFADEPGSQRYPSVLRWIYPDTGNFIAFVSNLGSRQVLRRALREFRAQASIPSEGGALPEGLPGVGWSDHWSFWQEGYRAILVTDTALFRYPAYHAEEDIPDQVDFERLARVVAGLEPVVAELAGGVTGTVEEVGLFVTTVNTPDNIRTFIGNGKIFSDTIQNFSTNEYRRVELTAQLASITGQAATCTFPLDPPPPAPPPPPRTRSRSRSRSIERSASSFFNAASTFCCSSRTARARSATCA